MPKEQEDLTKDLMALIDGPAEEADKPSPKPEQEEEAPDTEVSEAEEAEEVAEESEDEVEVEQEDVAPDEDLKDILDEDGDVDEDKLRKLVKSHKNAQSLVGKTSKDREEIKKFRAEYDRIAQEYGYLSQLAQEYPEISEAVKRAHMRKTGQHVEDSPAPKNEDTETARRARIQELLKAEKLEEATREIVSSMPELKEIAAMRRKMQEDDAARARAERDKELGAQFDAFLDKFGGMLYTDDKLTVGNDALYNEFSAQLSRVDNYEDALALACHKLGIPVRKAGVGDTVTHKGKTAGSMPRGKRKLHLAGGKTKKPSGETMAGIPVEDLSKAIDLEMSRRKPRSIK